jgi:hypothetical protein
MEYHDYDQPIWTAYRWMNRFLHGRGFQYTQSCKHLGIKTQRSVHKIEDYYEIAAKKRKLFWQSPLDNFQTNILRVGLLGFLECMTFKMTALSASKLSLWNPRNLMNSLSTGQGLVKGLYKGNGYAMVQFGLAHALPASLSQRVCEKTNTVVIDPFKYIGYSAMINLLLYPLQVAKLMMYNNPISLRLDSNLKAALCSNRALSSHLMYSAKNSFFVGSLAYLFSKDWSFESLLIAPVTLAYYVTSVQNYTDFQKSFGLKTERISTILRSNLGRNMFAFMVLMNFGIGYRYFGMASHDRIKSEYIHENEAKGMMPGYAHRTRQFRDRRLHNKNK